MHVIVAPLALFATSVHCVHTPLGLGSKKYPAAHASVTLLPAAVHVTLPEELGTASHCVHAPPSKKYPAAHASVTLLPAAVHVTLPEELGTASHCVHVAVFAGAKVPAVHTG